MVDDIVHLGAVLGDGGEGAMAGAVDVLGLGKDGLGDLCQQAGSRISPPAKVRRPRQ